MPVQKGGVYWLVGGGGGCVSPVIFCVRRVCSVIGQNCSNGTSKEGIEKKTVLVYCFQRKA